MCMEVSYPLCCSLMDFGLQAWTNLLPRSVQSRVLQSPVSACQACCAYSATSHTPIAVHTSRTASSFAGKKARVSEDAPPAEGTSALQQRQYRAQRVETPSYPGECSAPPCTACLLNSRSRQGGSVPQVLCTYTAALPCWLTTCRPVLAARNMQLCEPHTRGGVACSRSCSCARSARCLLLPQTLPGPGCRPAEARTAPSSCAGMQAVWTGTSCGTSATGNGSSAGRRLPFRNPGTGVTMAGMPTAPMAAAQITTGITGRHGHVDHLPWGAGQATWFTAAASPASSISWLVQYQPGQESGVPCRACGSHACMSPCMADRLLLPAETSRSAHLQQAWGPAVPCAGTAETTGARGMTGDPATLGTAGGSETIGIVIEIEIETTGEAASGRAPHLAGRRPSVSVPMVASMPHSALSKPNISVENVYGDAHSFTGVFLFKCFPQAGASQCLPTISVPSMQCLRQAPSNVQQHLAGKHAGHSPNKVLAGALQGTLQGGCFCSLPGTVGQPRDLPGQSELLLPVLNRPVLSQLALAGMMETACGTALPGGMSGSGRGLPAGTGEPPGGECTPGGPPGRPAHPQRSPPHVLAAQQVGPVLLRIPQAWVDYYLTSWV